jgi:hypothetical protein
MLERCTLQYSMLLFFCASTAAADLAMVACSVTSSNYNSLNIPLSLHVLPVCRALISQMTPCCLPAKAW